MMRFQICTTLYFTPVHKFTTHTNIYMYIYMRDYIPRSPFFPATMT